MAIERIALATRKGLLILTPDGDHWGVRTESFSGSHVSIVFLDDRSGHLFACLDDGHFGNKVFRWNNFASTTAWADADSREVWKEVEAPKYPEGSRLPDGKDAVTKYLWGMSTGADTQEGRLYLGTEPGGLFVSDNHGDSFELVSSLWNHPSRTAEGMGWFGGGRDQAGIHSVCVDPRNENHIRVGVSCAGVFLTEDGGQNWRPTNAGQRADFLPDPYAEVGHDPHMLVQCQSQPDIMWNQNHCGIFRSTDSGHNWQDVSENDGPANFGFAIAVDPDDGDVAWVVPAESDMVRSAVDRKMCVCRTDDGGKTWTAFRNGLPQHNCFDFAFRHNLLYEDGQVLFGTACGSLYLSNDRGENWKPLGSHFPPIYSIAVV